MSSLKYHKKLYILISFIILIGCKLQEPTKNHGILFLENRFNKLIVKSDNKNDVIKLIGHPHTKSISGKDNWIYIERVLTKGSFHKLGQNILKTNNVLVLSFDKYGILEEKVFLNKEDLKDLKFEKSITATNFTKKSFVQKFLTSIKTKMYDQKN